MVAEAISEQLNFEMFLGEHASGSPTCYMFSTQIFKTGDYSKWLVRLAPVNTPTYHHQHIQHQIDLLTWLASQSCREATLSPHPLKSTLSHSARAEHLRIIMPPETPAISWHNLSPEQDRV